jgi:glycosyltransferase involved in cell wall biosynthesis
VSIANVTEPGTVTLRIAHVAALLAEDAAYGGPLTVAVEQCSALAGRGHDVTLYVGWDGRAETRLDAGFAVVPVRVRRWLPNPGVTGLFSPRLLARVRRDIGGFDVAHVHFGRDPLSATCAAAAVRRAPTVLQTHGMVMPDPRLRATLLDSLTIRDTLHRASAVLYLTEAERAGLYEVAGRPVASHFLVNGISASPIRRTAWNGVAPAVVLFCARLHARKRATAFVRMCTLIHQRGLVARYLVAGPDEGELAQVLDEIGTARLGGVDIEYVGALSSSAARSKLASADVFVLPSDDEPFPMTILEAMAVGTPTVMTDSCGLADLVRRNRAGVVSSREPADLADAVVELVEDRSYWSAVSDAGHALVRTELSVDAVAGRLEELYGRLVSGSVTTTSEGAHG